MDYECLDDALLHAVQKLHTLAGTVYVVKGHMYRGCCGFFGVDVATNAT